MGKHSSVSTAHWHLSTYGHRQHWFAMRSGKGFLPPQPAIRGCLVRGWCSKVCLIFAGLNLHGGTTHPQLAPESCHGLATEPHLQCSDASTALARPQPAMWAGWLRLEDTKKANQQMKPKRKPKRKPRKGHQHRKPEKDTTKRKPKRKAKRTPKFRTPKNKNLCFKP